MQLCLYLFQHKIASKSVLSPLQVVEDVNEGHIITGLSTKAAKNSIELRMAFNNGRGNRDAQVRATGSSWPSLLLPAQNQVLTVLHVICLTSSSSAEHRCHEQGTGTAIHEQADNVLTKC